MVIPSRDSLRSWLDWDLGEILGIGDPIHLERRPVSCVSANRFSISRSKLDHFAKVTYG